MKKIAISLLALVVLFGCKDDPQFSSPEGSWTYTTPDGKIGVDFQLVLSGSNWNMGSITMYIDGVSTTDVTVQELGTTPPTFQNFRFNVNDLKFTYPYPLEFKSGIMNSDFTEINVPDASYTWPHDKTNELKNITIRRK